MLDKIAYHTERGHWILVPWDSIGNNRNILAVCFLKQKILPDGTLVKNKVILCANGSQKVHGFTYWDTYAPVVSRLAVRIMLILTIIENWHTGSINFTLAFPQATLTHEIYMELPEVMKNLELHVDPMCYDLSTLSMTLRTLDTHGRKKYFQAWNNVDSYQEKPICVCSLIID